MKKMRDYMFTLGATGVLMLSVVLAQDQAPAAAPVPVPPPAEPAPAVAPAPAAPAAVAPALPVLPAPGAVKPPTAVPAPAVPRRTASPLTASPLTRRPPAAGSVIPPAVPSAVSAAASSSTNAAGEAKAKTTTPSLKFDNAPADIIVSAYCEQTGKTPLYAPDAPKANITLKSQADAQLTKEEYIEAIEVVLSMNGIVLEPFGEKFVKVLARKTVRTDGIKIIMEGPEGGHPEKSRVVSQMIQLKAVTAAEAQKALEGFKKPEGLFQVFERTNSILVTDTQENVNRMLEIVKFIDQPLMVLEKVFFKVIRYAKADDIKKRLEELVAESQKQQQAKEEIKANTAGSPGFSRTTSSTMSTTSSRLLPPGLTRLGAPQQPAPVTPNETLEALVSDAERGMIRGKAQIIADERTNQLIIITREDNMAFFEKIITVLDIETLPDVKVEVMRLEFADAEEVSTMLNDLIGNVTSKKDDKAPANAPKSPATPGAAPDQPAKSTTLAEAVAARTASRNEAAAAGEASKSKLGQLSKDNIKILSDKRTNALVMMGSVGDLAAVKEIVKSMDIQLAQVLIETVALEVSLGDTLETGVDWVKRVKASGDNTKTVINADGTVSTVTSGDSNYRYGAGGGGGAKKLAQNLFDLGTNALTGVVTSGGSGIEYLATIKGLRLDMIVTAAKTDNSAKVLSSPVLLTVDNKEATIEATELKYMYKGMRYMGYSGGSGSSVGGYGGGSYEPDIEQRDVGLTVKVTPRISPSGNVVLTVEETFEDVLGSQTINGQDWPTITTRKLSADVSVGNGETVILGGLVKTSKSNSESGIPILKDIPYVGKYLFGSTKTSESRSELLVFLTPYVIETPEDMAREARRRKDYVNATDIWTKGWSDSKLADPVNATEMKDRLARKKELEKAWREYREKLEEHQKVDDRVTDERVKTEAVIDAHRPESREAFGTLKVEESVRVLKPEEGDEAPASPDGQPAGDETPVQPDIGQPRESWWKRIF